ncbi:MAG: hypothetical protein ACRDTN_17970 [Mycobacterium sp.]
MTLQVLPEAAVGAAVQASTARLGAAHADDVATTASYLIAPG